MAKKQDDLISFPMRLSHEVERLFDEMIHRPWGFCRDIRGWNPSLDLYETAEKNFFIFDFFLAPFGLCARCSNLVTAHPRGWIT
jgi:hypothetical protein